MRIVLYGLFVFVVLVEPAGCVGSGRPLTLNALAAIFLVVLTRDRLPPTPSSPPTILRPGAYDDPNGSHISIEVVSSLFEGKRPVQRQQLVYKAIWEELRGPVHAVDAMVCQTPAEAAAAT